MFWEAARSNVGNGVQYKAAEFLPVFRAFIKSKQHHKGRREYMSYREMSTALGLGVSYSTLRRWTAKEFPALFRAIAGEEGGAEGGVRDVESMSPDEQHAAEAHKAATALAQHAAALTDPARRGALLGQLEATAVMLRAKGVELPQF